MAQQWGMLQYSSIHLTYNLQLLITKFLFLQNNWLSLIFISASPHTP